MATAVRPIGSGVVRSSVQTEGCTSLGPSVARGSANPQRGLQSQLPFTPFDQPSSLSAYCGFVHRSLFESGRTSRVNLGRPSHCIFQSLPRHDARLPHPHDRRPLVGRQGRRPGARGGHSGGHRVPPLRRRAGVRCRTGEVRKEARDAGPGARKGLRLARRRAPRRAGAGAGRVLRPRRPAEGGAVRRRRARPARLGDRQEGVAGPLHHPRGRGVDVRPARREAGPVREGRRAIRRAGQQPQPGRHRRPLPPGRCCKPHGRLRRPARRVQQGQPAP